MKYLLVIACFSITLIGCKNNTNTTTKQENTKTVSKEKLMENLSTVEAIAYKNGFENWKNINEIAFTFNVDRQGNHSERSWIWNPKTNEMKMMADKDSVSYNRSKMDSIAMANDANFINDQYWLLAPFNLLWDDSIKFSEKKTVVAPISKDTLNLLTATYTSNGGYTPGDAYDFYYGDDFIVKEWTYRKGNATEPSMTTTWEEYQKFYGLNIATMHKDTSGNFKLYFTNISVK